MKTEVLALAGVSAGQSMDGGSFPLSSLRIKRGTQSPVLSIWQFLTSLLQIECEGGREPDSELIQEKTVSLQLHPVSEEAGSSISNFVLISCVLLFSF